MCEVANPARGQLNRENKYSRVPVRALEFGRARRVQPSRFLKKNLNASKPSEHPLSEEKLSKGLGGNINRLKAHS